MSPGKSSQISNSKDCASSENNCKGQAATHNVPTPQKHPKHADSNKLDSLASQLQNETEEKKETIMTEALKCIFTELPKAMFRLDALLAALLKLSESHYSNDAWLLDGKTDNLKASAGYVAAKYKFSFENASQAFPFGQTLINSNTQQTSALVSGKKILSSVCFCHLIDAKGAAQSTGKSKLVKDGLPPGDQVGAGEVHSCVNSYTFANSISLLSGGTVPINEDLSKFLDELRLIFVDLSQHFVIINLGLSLMFPRTEDNESSNLSLEVLNKLLNLASLDYVG